MSSLHRAGLVVAGFITASAAIAACAGTNEEAPPGPSDDGGVVFDQAAPDVIDSGTTDAGRDANVAPGDACSEAGWCQIEVDPKLTFDDLWPLGDSAVAIASRAGRSSVMLYEQSSWKVIHEVPFLLASVWASNTDVWVSGKEAGYVAHGHREGADWTWKVRALPVSTPVGVVWGTGEQEVYALADARVWRLSGDGDWAVDFGGPAPAEETTLIALTGTSKDDVWVTGVHGTYPFCGIVAHKTRGAWVPVIDATLNASDPDAPPCTPIGSAAVMPATIGIATSTVPGELVAITQGVVGLSLARVRHGGDAGVDITTTDLSFDFIYPKERRSLWGASADDLYLAGFSKVRRGRDLWADGGDWQISTVATSGVATVKPFHVVRGTQSDDVWLAGESYVFHKTIR